MRLILISDARGQVRGSALFPPSRTFEQGLSEIYISLQAEDPERTSAEVRVDREDVCLQAWEDTTGGLDQPSLCLFA